MKKALLIIAVVLVVGVVAFLLWRRRQAAQAPLNVAYAPPATVLPPITPPPGSPGFSWTDAHAGAIGATAQGTCMAYGGGQVCDTVGKVGTAVGKVYSQGVQKAASTVASGAKKVWNSIF